MKKIFLAHAFFGEHARDLMRGKAAETRRFAQAEGAVVHFSQKVDAAFLKKAPRLRALGTFSVGLDHIDLAACRARGVRVVHTPDVLTRATAEQAIALLLACARRTAEGDRLCRRGRGWTPAPDFMLGQGLAGRRALVVGAGRIGRETGRLLRALGLHVQYAGRGDRALSAKLRRAQVLSLHLPLTPQTRHWLDASRLRLLPPDAIVINTGRGGLVDEAALVRALRARRIFGAGLDVFEGEPRSPRAFLRLENVVLAPHLGSATLETRRAMARLAVGGVLALLAGRKPANEVRP